MSFKTQFDASQAKAHNRIIATKIHQAMEKLRAEVDASPTTSRRWIWELIQNAKDVSIAGRVRVRIEADLDGAHPRVTFKHDGGAFSAENIRFLIEQVSSKDRTHASDGRPTTTGKFGTGFLTTHLLSERVVINGVAEGHGFATKKFELLLDRGGLELEDIIGAVEAAKLSIQGLDDQPDHTHVPGEFNTSFRYDLSDATGKKVARAGLSDLDICAPYTLAFTREIQSIEDPVRVLRLHNPDDPRPDGEVRVVAVSAEAKEGTKTHYLAVLTRGLTTIAIPVEQTELGVQIVQPSRQIPRLFCDFPLLGTESFPVPVIINNPTLNPTEPRDGIYLAKSERASAQSDHNRRILEDALSLYLSLLEHASQQGWQDLHFLAAICGSLSDVAQPAQNWYQTIILKPMHRELERTKIVRTAAGDLAAIYSAEGARNIWFPSNPLEHVRNAIWRCCEAWIPDRLPAQSDVEVWNDIIWPECARLTLDQIAAAIERAETTGKLESELHGKSAPDLLTEFYATLKLDEPAFQSVISKRRIFPNQNGVLKRKADLFRDAGDIDPDLLGILKLLGKDLGEQLLDAALTITLDDMPTRDGAYVVNEIASTIERSINDRAALERLRPALSKLLQWFRASEARAKEHFSMLYEQRHRLYDDAEIVANIQRAAELNDLLSEFQVKTVQELRAVITKQSASQLLPVTQEIIASLGIASVEEWTKALADKDLRALFSHASTATPDMFVYAQSLIEKCKRRVIEHLSGQPEYDLTEMDETALTVLAGVKKTGRDVSIVMRPAYDGTVIIYYQSERDVLDYEDHELWVDTGSDVRRITFGHILKSTNIRRFPI